MGNEFSLSIAPDGDSTAPGTDGTIYHKTDEGIREMYLALAANPIFSRLKFCYVPGRIGADLDPSGNEAGIASRAGGPLRMDMTRRRGFVPWCSDRQSRRACP